MIVIVAIQNEDNMVRPNIPTGVAFEVLHYDLENNQASVRITSNPNNLPIETIGE